MKTPTTSLKEFEEGQLCYVVLRNFQGEGPLRLILHAADSTENKGFAYGAGKTWVISPGTMMGLSISERKKMAARLNGKKGGRPPKNPPIPA